MEDTSSDSDTHGYPNLSSDELFHILSAANRRTVLFHLRQHRAATLDELLDVLTEVGTDDTDKVDRERVHSSLLHSHLPKLEDYGLVTHNQNEQIVESTSLHGNIGEWLDLAVRNQIQFENATDTRGRSDEGIQVLLVDDEPGLPETIGAYIEREADDIAVTTAMSTPEAVTTLEKKSFDCIVSDYQMPAISGLDFLKVVRQEDADIPFIVFTAKGSETIASQAIATGVTDYVQKGPDTKQFDELIDRIHNAVNKT
ncbi:response regulator [Natronorubrum bangense]|uniref:Pas domain s-box n=2 Tax=Natronorubrum bangense TaxID=61858 RepID=L9W9W2_9EURY|nr:response regulator [Natronorubrum bangense]ELY46254.1 pas domain s-box [Natronorubrum bangense JCM 10635]QCC56608.1 response regulator [Natronorubrum bangense]